MPDFYKMPEVFVSTFELATAISREVKAGRLRKLGSRLYTRNLKDAPEKIAQRNLWPLVDAYLPDALIVDRTALENRPAADGSVFLISHHKRNIVIPGVTLRPRKGPPPIEGDRPFIGRLRIASPARAFLENMRRSRARDFAQRDTIAIGLSDIDRARFILEKTHAFRDSNEADAEGIRLMIPTPELVTDGL